MKLAEFGDESEFRDGIIRRLGASATPTKPLFKEIGRRKYVALRQERLPSLHASA
jgi:hypothetical protein